MFQHIKEENTKQILAAIFFAKPPSSTIKYLFQKTGLSHLLCISGLHLVLCFSMLNKFLSFFFKGKNSALITMILVSCYVFLCLPSSASINRAYLALLLYTFGKWQGFSIFSINLLGGVALICLVIKPSDILNIGFQLSYTATFALLWLLPFIKSQLILRLPSRSLKTTLAMPWTSKFGFIVLSYIKIILALNLAIAIVSLPLLLYHFNSISILSFIYNLFCPSFFVALVLLSYITFALMLIFPPIKPYLSLLLEFCFSSFFHLILFFPKKLSLDYSLPINGPLIPLIFLMLVFLFPLNFVLNKESKQSSLY